MLKNKTTMKNLDEFVKNLSEDRKNTNMTRGDEMDEMEEEDAIDDTMQRNPMDA